MKRFSIVALILFLANYYYRTDKENVDFERYHDLKFNKNVYADLTSGGMEFGEQWLTNL